MSFWRTISWYWSSVKHQAFIHPMHVSISVYFHVSSSCSISTSGIPNFPISISSCHFLIWAAHTKHAHAQHDTGISTQLSSAICAMLLCWCHGNWAILFHSRSSIMTFTSHIGCLASIIKLYLWGVWEYIYSFLQLVIYSFIGVLFCIKFYYNIWFESIFIYILSAW